MGGQTWTEVQTDIWDHIRSLYFVSDLEGWAVGDRGMIVHTSDGGQSWETQKSGLVVLAPGHLFRQSEKGLGRRRSWNSPAYR